MIRAAACVAVLGALLHAQASRPAPSPFRFVPRDALLVVQADGPARWPERFAQTRAAKLLAGDAAARLLLGPLGAMTLDQSGALAPLLERLSGYAGRVTLFAWCPWREVLARVGGADDTPEFLYGLVLEPDGRTDLAAVAAQCRRLQRTLEPDAVRREIVFAGRTWPGFAPSAENKGTLTLPELDHGQLCAFSGVRLAEACKRIDALPQEQRFAADASWASAGLAVRCNAGAALGPFVEWAGSAQEVPSGVVLARRLVKELGLDALDAVELRVEPAGRFVQVTESAAFTTPPRGVLGALLPPPRRKPELQWLVPDGASSFAACSVRLPALYDAGAGLWDALERAVPLSLSAFELEFFAAAKVRLRQDLIGWLGDAQMLAAGTFLPGSAQVRAGGPNDADARDVGVVCVLRVTNGTMFEQSLEKAVRAQGLHATRKTADHRGTKVHELVLIAALPVAYAVCDDVAVLAFGKAGPTGLRAVLDARAEGPGRRPRTEPVPERLQRTCLGVQVLDLRTVAAFARLPEPWADLLKSAHELGLDLVVTTADASATGLTITTLW